MIPKSVSSAKVDTSQVLAHLADGGWPPDSKLFQSCPGTLRNKRLGCVPWEDSWVIIRERNISPSKWNIKRTTRQVGGEPGELFWELPQCTTGAMMWKCAETFGPMNHVSGKRLSIYRRQITNKISWMVMLAGIQENKADLTTWSANKIRSFVFDRRWLLPYFLFIHL